MEEFRAIKIEKDPEFKLNTRFSQSLWHKSENDIISRDAIKECLFEFFNQMTLNEMAAPEAENPNRQLIIAMPLSQLLASKISGKIRMTELSSLHKAIGKSRTDIERKNLSNRHIFLIIQAIHAVLAENTLSPEQKEFVKKLLS
ncbi:MAG: hypothetical protein WD963_02025 [Candidatus Paceibacterota bacterium]